MNLPIKAHCQCGQVSYELRAKPLKVVACHCRECQILSGAPYSVTAMVNASDISFFGAMSDWCRSSDSGNVNAAKLCGECGNRIYHYNPEMPELLKLKLKPIDKELTTLFSPSAHVWVKEKVPWLTLPEGTVTYDTM